MMSKINRCGANLGDHLLPKAELCSSLEEVVHLLLVVTLEQLVVDNA